LSPKGEFSGCPERALESPKDALCAGEGNRLAACID